MLYYLYLHNFTVWYNYSIAYDITSLCEMPLNVINQTFWIRLHNFIFPGKNITPGRSGSGDRFIPNRSASQYELGQFLVSNAGKTNDDALLSPSKLQMQKAMSENLNGDLANAKILGYRQKPPMMPEGEYSLLF